MTLSPPHPPLLHPLTIEPGNIADVSMRVQIGGFLSLFFRPSGKKEASLDQATSQERQTHYGQTL